VLVEPDEVDDEPGPLIASRALMVVGRSIPIVPGVYSDRVDWLDPIEAARHLYETLHRWDQQTLQRIDVVLPPEEDAWHGIRDRLWRASRRWAREGTSSPGA
jgi:hypothetical protein